ncbi:MAG TPA: tetratricopeptide repeat protein, partial [Vicinamibacterales bacterium]|nr:tetratricopeptide repeat protein [Vicinamibacterales bacterium]
MRRVLAIGGLAVAIGTLIVLVLRLDRDRQYRTWLATGEQALAGGDFYGAIEAYSAALALRPDSMVAHLRKGEAYRAQRRDDEAIRDLLDAVRLAPDAPQPLVALGELYATRGEAAQADKWYSAAARLKGDDPELLYALALARYRAGLPAAAVEPLKKAVARNDSLAEVHHLLALVSRDIGDLEEAIASLERAIRLAPTLVAAREELADVYRSQNRPADEMEQLQALATLDPKIDRQIAIALAQLRTGQTDLALGTLSGIEDRAPNDSRVPLARGRVFLARAERGNQAAAEAALAALERALGGTARRSEGLALFGRALYLTGDLSGAERILQEAVATSPLEPQAYAFLADTCERLGHFVDARNALMDLDALEGSTAPAERRAARASRIGTLSLEALDYGTAATFLGRAADLRPTDARVLGHLARARWAFGDHAGARDALARARAIDADDP